MTVTRPTTPPGSPGRRGAAGAREDNLASLLRILALVLEQWRAGWRRPPLRHRPGRPAGCAAEQQVPLDTVLSTYRLGGRFVLWEALVDLAKRDDGIDRDSLLDWEPSQHGPGRCWTRFPMEVR
ncbi:hypothetical protein [Fodinicola feengrottensis]|uniref:hypothetical protein n=1 Tax=Fodinicola feengrottensis TaxID=435914 RepID=UPI0013D050B2|nr:hypothetical protein [Fodinicola feengrottensis]